MAVPAILALDFDGVLCDGMLEYFEVSRRACAQIWSDDPGDALFPAFARLRPVITTGWEMPLLLRAIARGRSEAEMSSRWEAVRDGLLREDDRGRTLVASLTSTIDEIRRQWMADHPDDWLARNRPYCAPEEIRRLAAEPEMTVLVTTKEGEFARAILDHWAIALAGIQGKEAGAHKCENLRGLIAAYAHAHGRLPQLWFVEDRLETLQHVTRHADLDDVGLFLAAWGYNTAETRAAAQEDSRIRLLELAQFRRGCAAW
jgi:hypothetical protein